MSDELDLTDKYALALSDWDTEQLHALMMGSLWAMVRRLPPDEVADYLLKFGEELKAAKPGTVH